MTPTEDRSFRPEAEGATPGEHAGDAGDKKRVFVCDRCGFEMYEKNCKVVCPNCGSRYDCSDLNIYFD